MVATWVRWAPKSIRCLKADSKASAGPSKDTASQQRAYLPRLRADLQDPTLFRKIYVYAFDYAKTEGQKSLRMLSPHPLPG
jgi:DCN1-like protein 1/2